MFSGSPCMIEEVCIFIMTHLYHLPIKSQNRFIFPKVLQLINARVNLLMEFSSLNFCLPYGYCVFDP